ncbi:MAG: UDP-2,3-diacylglucosamine diphosphatase [Bacteroidales bacterium]|nr:UDP-2,3-diacylglucosamine diphosphatase [Bacteroidales bacterium]MDG2082059.1 UDP-2,3-diacylglucosamine diphosphatase [Bacteroidales bacterium]
MYFASDFHLGIPDHESSLLREKKLVRWLDMVSKDADEIFLMGDLFDFWFEYKYVVPKGYVRLLGKLAEITDDGIPVHMFRGNHDIWAFNYLTNELNIKLYRNPILREFDGKKFFLAHGDGLGPGDNGYKFLKKVFEFKPNQWLFRWLHPDIGSRMGLYFSQKSRLANITKSKNNVEKVDIDNEMLFHYAHETLSKQPDINYFVFGHRHIPIQKNIADNSELIILGDWLNIFSYGVFENGIMRLEYFEADH